MSTAQLETEERQASRRRHSFGQRLWGRYGAAAIMIVVLLVVIGWIGILGWGLMSLLG
ncbi:hypothetical protein ACRAWG_01560 [Methylobacterium sp. P31]